MAKKNERLIGFDPLAWMEAESEQGDDLIDQGKTNTETKIETEADTLDEPELQQTDDSSHEVKLTLDTTLNIQSVGRLHEQVLKLLENQEKIEIDASSVTVIDTATLQLLVILKKTAVELHKEVIIDFPSENFIESAELLGLSETLEVDQAAAGFF